MFSKAIAMIERSQRELTILDIQKKMDEAEQYKVVAKGFMLDEDCPAQKARYKNNYEYWLGEYHHWSSLLTNIIKLYRKDK